METIIKSILRKKTLTLAIVISLTIVIFRAESNIFSNNPAKPPAVIVDTEGSKENVVNVKSTTKTRKNLVGTKKVTKLHRVSTLIQTVGVGGEYTIEHNQGESVQK